MFGLLRASFNYYCYEIVIANLTSVIIIDFVITVITVRVVWDLFVRWLVLVSASRDSFGYRQIKFNC